MSEPRKSVLIMGLEPELIDFSKPAYAAFPGLTAEKVRAGIEASRRALIAAGYDVEFCEVDFGETAETVAQQRLAGRAWDCVLIGAGVRVVPEHFLLFEKLVNVVHRAAPGARICFNTHPGDTAEAIRRGV